MSRPTPCTRRCGYMATITAIALVMAGSSTWAAFGFWAFGIATVVIVSLIFYFVLRRQRFMNEKTGDFLSLHPPINC